MARTALAGRKKKTPAPKMSNSVRKIAETKHIGNLTTNWEGVRDIKTAIRDNLAYNNYFHDYKDAVKWVLDYLKFVNADAATIRAYKAAEDWRTSVTVGSYAKMIMEGAPIDDKDSAWLENKIAEIVDAGRQNLSEKKSGGTAVAKTPADILKENTSDFIAELEEMLDNLPDNPKQYAEFSLYEKMKAEETPYNTAKAVNEYYAPLEAELSDVISKKDKELVEAYSHIGVRIRRDLYNFVKKLVDESEMYMTGKKAQRKPRKARAKKVASREKMVSKVNYRKEEPSLKIVSVHPEKIIGSSIAFLYNVKYRTLTVLQSNEATGLQIRGTTVENFDESKSFKKTIRKPEEFLPKLNTIGTKLKAIKAIDGLTTRKSESTGRIGNDTIILRVFS